MNSNWFNPLLWFAFARMRADRESACDARVLSIDASDRRAEYGGALLKLQCVTPTRALSLGFVGITSQVGKYPHPESEFFKSACVLTELQRMLGLDYQAYREHLLTAGAGMLEKEGDYVCGDVSQLHVGGYGSLFYVDPKNEKMYLFLVKGKSHG